MRPFSNFNFVDKHFGDNPAIRRLFSLARTFGGKTLVIESLQPKGNIASENKEITDLFPDYKTGEVKRISFWTSKFKTTTALKRKKSKELIGYAIIKRDIVPSCSIDFWHVFESVFIKYPHEHNCVPQGRRFRVCINQRTFNILGVMYCQQNALNKACAQVALRSLLAGILPKGDISYQKINELAATAFIPDSKHPTFKPKRGLQVAQIQAVLRGLGIEYTDIDYSNNPPEKRKTHPYQKLVYAGIESGAGALMAFKLAGPAAPTSAHVVPAFGHTFNKDTWVNYAEHSYFHIGANMKYIPSDTWVSSLLAHDDNFGSNFCIPRQYVDREHVLYALAVHKNGFKYCGMLAEGIVPSYLYSILPYLNKKHSPWVDRLLNCVSDQDIVLRAIAMDKAQYIKHITSLRDWQKKKEQKMLLNILASSIPEKLWVVEVSIPELFSANQRKVGEIVLDATLKPKPNLEFNIFVLARLPGQYLFFKKTKDSKPVFLTYPSAIKSHTALYVGW